MTFTKEEIKNKIFCGHVINVLQSFPDESVDLVVTSSPYYSLRSYMTEPQKWKDGWVGELGQENTPDQFVEHLCEVFDEVKRVLKPTGSMYINLGETYSGSMQGYGAKKASESGFEKAAKDREYLISSTRLPPVAECGIPKKSMCGVPMRFAIEMIERGWILRNFLVWRKLNGKPESVKDRYTNNWEPVFFFTKNQDYYFKQILEPLAESTLKRCEGNFVSEKNKKYGMDNTSVKKWSEKVLSGEVTGKNKRAVWDIPVEHAYKSKNGEHHAVFPTALIKTPILASCPKDGIVMDIFNGTATTCLVARELGRNYVGIELNPKYCEIAAERLDLNQKKIGDF